jgi:hypothetical protein
MWCGSFRERSHSCFPVGGFGFLLSRPHSRQRNAGSHRTAWWAREDSNLQPERYDGAFQSSVAERPLSAICLWNISPARWQRSIRSRLHTSGGPRGSPASRMRACACDTASRLCVPTCFAVPHSPWPRPFAPRAPPQPRPLCSLASLLLRAGPTSRAHRRLR